MTEKLWLINLDKYINSDQASLYKTYRYLNVEDTLLNLAARFDSLNAFIIIYWALFYHIFCDENATGDFEHFLAIVAKAYSIACEHGGVRCQTFVIWEAYEYRDKDLYGAEEFVTMVYEYRTSICLPIFDTILTHDAASKLKDLIDDGYCFLDWRYFDEDFGEETFTAIGLAIYLNKWDHVKILYQSGADMNDTLYPDYVMTVHDYLCSWSNPPDDVRKFFHGEFNGHWWFGVVGRARVALDVEGMDASKLPAWARARIANNLPLPHVCVDTQDIFVCMMLGISRNHKEPIPKEIFDIVQRFLAPPSIFKRQ